MTEFKELHYRDNMMKHAKAGTKWCLTIIGLPVGLAYYALAGFEAFFVAFHWILNISDRDTGLAKRLDNHDGEQDSASKDDYQDAKERMEELQDLHESGKITDEEFEKKKEEILNDI